MPPKIQIIKTHQNADLASGLTIVIDVYRAFSTACYIMSQEPESFLVTADIDYALELKDLIPNSVLIGERNSIKINGFDYTNSPSIVKDIPIKGKTIIFNTSAGTQGIIKSVNASEIITGSFVNADAIIKYIINQNPSQVSLVCTNSDLEENEDVFFAQYISDVLNDKAIDINQVILDLRNHNCSSWFLDPLKTSHPLEDIDLCLNANKFSFVLKANKINDRLFELGFAI